VKVEEDAKQQRGGRGKREGRERGREDGTTLLMNYMGWEKDLKKEGREGGREGGREEMRRRGRGERKRNEKGLRTYLRFLVVVAD
jgi:hypothetical protein